MIIDFHVHTFPDKIASSTIANLAQKSKTEPFSDGSVGGLKKMMERAGVDYAVNLPVATNVAQVEKLNTNFINDMDDLIEGGIIPFGAMHPDYPDYKKELRRLAEAGIPGIKIHPAYQNVLINDIRYMRIIDCANENGLIVLTHAGVDIGIYDKDYAPISGIIDVVDTVHPDKFVLAHMGGWLDWEDFERDLAGGPVYIDTAFSIGPIHPDPNSAELPIANENLSDEDFMRICRKHGTDKVLFATDSPWADESDYIGRIKDMAFTGDEKERIFSGNALRLFGEL